MRKQLLAVMALALPSSLAGCTPQRATPFDEGQFSRYAVPGTAIIGGQAFMRTQGGEVKTAAGLPVYLAPVTAYTQAWYDKQYLAGQNLTPPDAREGKYVRQTIADAGGNFSFGRLPAGDYFVRTAISWRVDAYSSSGGTLCQPVHVDDGQTQRVILTR